MNDHGYICSNFDAQSKDHSILFYLFSSLPAKVKLISTFICLHLIRWSLCTIHFYFFIIQFVFHCNNCLSRCWYLRVNNMCCHISQFRVLWGNAPSLRVNWIYVKNRWKYTPNNISKLCQRTSLPIHLACRRKKMFIYDSAKFSRQLQEHRRQKQCARLLGSTDTIGTIQNPSTLRMTG